MYNFLFPKFYEENKILCFSFLYIYILASYLAILCFFFQVGFMGFLVSDLEFRSLFILIHIIFLCISFLSFRFFWFLIFFFLSSLVFFYYIITFKFSTSSLILDFYIFEIHKVLTIDDGFYFLSRETLNEPFYIKREIYDSIYVPKLGRRFTTEDLLKLYAELKPVVEVKPRTSFFQILINQRNNPFYSYNKFIIYYNENLSPTLQPNVYLSEPKNIVNSFLFFIFFSASTIYFILLLI